MISFWSPYKDIFYKCFSYIGLLYDWAFGTKQCDQCLPLNTSSCWTLRSRLLNPDLKCTCWAKLGFVSVFVLHFLFSLLATGRWQKTWPFLQSIIATRHCNSQMFCCDLKLHRFYLLCFFVFLFFDFFFLQQFCFVFLKPSRVAVVRWGNATVAVPPSPGELCQNPVSAGAQRAQWPAALPAATSPACGFKKDLVVFFPSSWPFCVKG